MTASTCPNTGKVAHLSRQDALAHLRALRARGGSVDLNVYRCPFGGTHWHVGHSWYRLRRRIREAKRRGVA